MAFGPDKTCFNCFWEWEDEGFSRCTRLPPLPILHDPVAIDATRMNKISFAPCPGIPACGEWRTREVIEPVEIELGEQRKE